MITQKTKSLYISNKIPWIIIGVGIVLRLVRYLYNPSLWFDESDIVIDIISRPISELINPSPDYNQAYPLAFMILTKLATQVYGNSEYVIRLIPLLSSISTLFLFYRVVRSYLEPNAVLIALGLFAILDSLIFEASNLKPYSSDVLFTLLIYTLTIYVQSTKLNMWNSIFMGCIGAIAIWFSNPSVFVLAGVGLSLGIFSLINKNWEEIGMISVSYSIWGLSFFANYFLYIQNLQGNFGINMDEMLAIQNAYMPIPPSSFADIKWFIELFFDVFSNPLAMTLTGIGALSFLAGCISMCTQKRREFIFIIAPVVITFLAAALHEYAFKGRFIFFLLPSLLIILAEGAEHIRSRIYQNSKIIGIIFVSLLLFHPISLSAYRIIKPFYWEDIKPVLTYVKDNWKEGDVLYVHYYAQYPFDYYSNYYPEPYRFKEGEYIIGIAPRGWYRNYKKQDAFKYYDAGAPIEQSSADIFNLYAKELDHLKGKKRVWLLFTAAIIKDGINEERFFIYNLKKIGKQLDFIGLSGTSSAYLFDLSEGLIQ